MSEKPKKHIRPDGSIEYRLNGKLHREDGPAKIWPNGSIAWCLNGKLHRTGGPAAIFPSDIIWYTNSKYHRLDGPAVIQSNILSGSFIRWFIHGINYQEEDYIEYLLEYYPQEISIVNLLKYIQS